MEPLSFNEYQSIKKFFNSACSDQIHNAKNLSDVNERINKLSEVISSIQQNQKDLVKFKGSIFFTEEIEKLSSQVLNKANLELQKAEIALKIKNPPEVHIKTPLQEVYIDENYNLNPDKWIYESFEKMYAGSIKILFEKYPERVKEAIITPIKDGMTPLYLALNEEGEWGTEMIQLIAKIAPEEFKKAMKMKLDPWKAPTPAHLAATKGDLDRLKIMYETAPIEFKEAMKRETLYSWETPAFIAACKNHWDVVAFIAHIEPESLKILNREGLSAYQIIKARRPPIYDEIKKIYKNDKNLKELSKEVFKRKAVAHTSHQKGVSAIMATNGSSKTIIKAEGYSSPQWFKMFRDNLSPFLNYYPDLLSSDEAAMLHQIFEMGSNTSLYTPQDKLQRIKDGFPTIIDSTFLGAKAHAVTVLIWGNQFVICNRGLATRAPLEIYHFDVNKLKEQDIARLETLANLEAYEQYVLEELPWKLGCENNELDTKLIDLNKLAFQTVGNCSLASPQAARDAALILCRARGMDHYGRLVHEGFVPTKDCPTLEKAVEQAEFVDQKLELNDRITALEKIILPLKKGSGAFKPDENLILSSLKDLVSLPNLDEISKHRIQEIHSAFKAYQKSKSFFSL